MAITNLFGSYNLRTPRAKPTTTPVFSIDGKNISLESTQIITSEADFPASVGGLHPLEHKTYLIDGEVTIVDGLEMAPGTTITSAGLMNSALDYTGTGVFFRARDANFSVSGITLGCANGTLIDAEDITPGVHDVLFNELGIRACDKIGRAKNLNSLAMNTLLFNEITTSGLDFEGNFSAFAFEFAGAKIDAGILFNLGTATFDIFDVSSYSITVNSGSTFMSGLTDSGNINTGGLGQVLDGRLTGAGTDLVGLNVLDDLLWRFDNSNRLQDTAPDALLSFRGNALETAITTINTPVKVNAVYTIDKSSFFTADSTGKVTYNGIQTITAPIDVSFRVFAAGGGSKNITVYLALNGTVISGTGQGLEVSGNNGQTVSIPWQLDLDTDDFIEPYIENNSGTDNLVAVDGIIRVL